MAIFSALFLLFRSLFVSRLSLATEILVLHQQLLVLNRTVKRPKLRQRDRRFWVCLSRLWRDWWDATTICRPPINREIRQLIRRISRENLPWGSPRIQSERRLLGFNV